MMQYAEYNANDGCTLAFQTSLPLPTSPTEQTCQSNGDPRRHKCILLIHGFSGSSEYFTQSFSALGQKYWVVAPDLRGHGRSGRPQGGFHVARLAMDLHQLVVHLRQSAPDLDLQIIPVGCSIGAAVLWTYVELFACADFHGFVFVDQAPLQDRSSFGDWDVSKAHRGCFDEASMLAAQRAWMSDPVEAHRGLVADCLGYRFAPRDGDDLSPARRSRDEAFFMTISAQCNQQWLARLLADHTRYDHRESIEEITIPTVVMAGRRTGCFPLEGMAETVERVNKIRPGLAELIVFESGHWLFYEEPEKFNKAIIDFADACFTKPAPR